MSEDPARDGGNWFLYCHCNPANRLDPDGAKDGPLDETERIEATLAFLTGAMAIAQGLRMMAKSCPEVALGAGIGFLFALIAGSVFVEGNPDFERWLRNSAFAVVASGALGYAAGAHASNPLAKAADLTEGYAVALLGVMAVLAAEELY